MRRMPNFVDILKHISTPARRQDTRDGGDERGAGITSAQHPRPEAPKEVHDSYLPAIIRTASPNLHIEPRRRSNRDKDWGALSLSPATSRISPHPGTTTEATTPAPVAQWIEQAPSKRLAAGSSPAGGAIWVPAREHPGRHLPLGVATPSRDGSGQYGENQPQIMGHSGATATPNARTRTPCTAPFGDTASAPGISHSAVAHSPSPAPRAVREAFGTGACGARATRSAAAGQERPGR